MEELDRTRAHQPRGDGRRRRIEHEVPVLGNPPPVAIIAEEALAAGAVLAGVWPRLGYVAGYALADSLDPVAAEEAAQRDRAVAPKGCDVSLANRWLGIAHPRIRRNRT